MKTLELSFVTTGGKTARVTIDDPIEPVDVEQVKTAMQAMIDAQIFHDNDGKMYEEMKGARLLERSITEYSLD